ncbi:MAG: alpha-1,2-fucosyltransferase, partial [Sphingobacteriaceae bacterium]
MIVVKISHGLGNQLFQYATARHLSIIKNTSLCLDTRYYQYRYETDTLREFKLKPFNLRYSLLHRNPPLVKLSKATKLVKGRTLKPFFHLISKQGNAWTPEVQNANSLFIYLKGFWQSEKYFKESEDIIRKELSFSFLQHSITHRYHKLISEAANPVSLHIRRGDYVNNPGINNQYGFIGLQYYQDAIRFMQQQTGSCQFFVFSDDPVWVAQNLNIGQEYTFINNEEGDGDMADIHLMSLCKHNIIAN